MFSPPTTDAELLLRARSLGGRTLAEVADALGTSLPDLRRAKGFVGQLTERALGGATPGAGPDFRAIGVELKTLPVDARGRVSESTFVCGAALASIAERDWATSHVRAKLARVLFIPVEVSGPARSDSDRRFGSAFLWSPSDAQEAQLRADYDELAGAIGAGALEGIDGRVGAALQLRPKGADANARVRAYDADGAPWWAPARAFYLRARFTRALIDDAGLAPRE